LSRLGSQAMRDALERNPEALVSMVNQSREHPRTAGTAFVFVEGSGDRNVYSAFSSERAKFVIAHGRKNVRTSVRLLQKRGVEGVLGIEDADCDRLRGVRPDPLVCVTDGHDLEAMILRSRALERVLAELGDAKRIDRFESRGRSVREALLDAVRPLGLAKYLKLRGGLKDLDISSKDLAHERFIDPTTIAMDFELFCDYMSERCGGRQQPEQIAREIQAVKLHSADNWDVCRGHDLVGALAVALSAALGTRRRRVFDVEQALRLAFDSLAFARTGVCAGMLDWQSRQPGFKVLHDDMEVLANTLRG